MKIAYIQGNQLLEGRSVMDCTYSIYENSQLVLSRQLRANYFPQLMDIIFDLSKENEIHDINCDNFQLTKNITIRNNMTECIFDNINFS